MDFQYNSIGQLTRIDRYGDLTGQDLVAKTTFPQYRADGLMLALNHDDAGDQELAHYTFTYDDAGQMTGMTSPERTSTYGYDDNSQLETATHSDDLTDESYTYDLDGNRTNAGYDTDAYNLLASDGVYNYTYDGDGNLLTKTAVNSPTSVRTYTWDNRHRLCR